MKDARAAYANAQGLPTRHETYTSPQGSKYLIFVSIHIFNCAIAEKYTGKDVRQAVFSFEVAQAKGGVGYDEKTGKQAALHNRQPKTFEDREKLFPGTAVGTLNEFPIMHNARHGYDGRKPNPSEARIITQKNVAGQTVLIGKTGHPPGDSNDHVAF
jgi:hypothetical protein